VGLLWDLQDAVGPDEPRQRLLGHLQEHAGYGLRWRISGLLKSGAMRTREDRDFTLYEDSVVTVVGNTNASAVYCDVAAFFSEKELESGHVRLRPLRPVVAHDFPRAPRYCNES
jgi:hypothetical protein